MPPSQQFAEIEVAHRQREVKGVWAKGRIAPKRSAPNQTEDSMAIGVGVNGTHEARTAEIDAMHERDEAHDRLARELAVELLRDLAVIDYRIQELMQRARQVRGADDLGRVLDAADRTDPIGDQLHDEITSGYRRRLEAG